MQKATRVLRVFTGLGRYVGLAWVWMVCLPPTPAAASAHGICDQVARQAARESGVPLSVMKAITRTETGRVQGGRLTPWPWTVNMEGAGHWFDNRAEAEAYVAKHHARGARSYDVGCFQINYRWHGQHFSSPTAMFDPLANARYAARFLSELYAETADWSKAAGAYHSRTPKYATRYRTRFDRIRSGIDSSIDGTTNGVQEGIPLVAQATPNAVPRAPRPNLYPLLQPGAQSLGFGSLVPNTASSRPALITLDGRAQP
ncbi:MAG: transglycosylase SLT domain-containing protein [Pseudomonadota bacterium]